MHNHTDDVMFSQSGEHAVEPYVEAWTTVLRTQPDALLYPTMAAGARGIPVERRWAHVEALAPLGSLTLIDPGSVNLGLSSDGMVAPEGAAGPYQNSLADIEHMLDRTAALGAGASVSIFEPGFLRTVVAFQRAGRLSFPVQVKLYFGGDLAFGLPPTRKGLDAYLELLEPTGLPWSVAVLGGDVVDCGLAELAITRGGGVRVGLEDYAGADTPSNPQLLGKAVDPVQRLGRELATCAQARGLLGLPDLPPTAKPPHSNRSGLTLTPPG